MLSFESTLYSLITNITYNIMSQNVYYDIAIRLDGQSSEKLIEFLDQDGGSYLVVKELEDSNPHFHVVLHTRRKLQAVRMAFRRQFPELKGNGAYSISAVRDVDKYHRYLMKGESSELQPNVIAANGVQYSNVLWQQAQHDEYWQVNQELQEAERKLPVAEVVLKACKEVAVQWSNREKISELYIRELVVRDKPINLHSVRAAVSLLQVKLCPDDQAILDLAAHCVQY